MPRRSPLPAVRRLAATAAAMLLLALVAAVAPRAALADACTGPGANPVSCENSKPGAAPDTWEVEGEGDPSIQGFATSMSVTPGQTISFKIKSATSNYHIDILRLGYYGGDGARVIASGLTPTGTSTQPACLTDTTGATGLIDCGNWSVSRTWTVPSDAVSGVYMAHLVRNDTGGDSKILFVVRDDSSHSDILVSTSDATWQAYNSYGGNSLYVCTVSCPPGDPAAYKSAFKVSYNRPLDTEDKNGHSSFFGGGEYPMIRFLEANGYDVSYTSSVDVASRGSLLLNHKVFMSSGHDEYWSASQRANVEAARDAGVNLAFFSGNEMFWKTRWEPSADGTNTANRTLVSYKDTHFTSRQDPVAWTGSWADPRFVTSADGVTPQNALTGQLFLVNAGTADLTVPAAYGKLRLWRDTAAATQAAGSTLTLGADTLGYEWDVDADNGFRPAGQIDLSSTTASGLQTFTDYGSTTRENDTATHHLTLYRAPSGALVFGAGTVQWSWGLDADNAGFTTPNRTMQQATLNLLADMGAQPYAPLAGLTRATASTDTTAPTATITSLPSTVADGTAVTIAGTASDQGGGIVAGVEVSTDGGSTWHPATGTTSWTYSWTAHGTPSTTIEVRATDDSANTQPSPTTRAVAVTCPCSVWGTSFTPPNAVANDNEPIEVGVKFRSDVYGAVTGIRFYKMAANTGTHTGTLWTADGRQLATATFSGESATGWQTVTFSNPVPIQPGTTYVASYHAPVGEYAATAGYFWNAPAPTMQGGAITDAGPLHILHSSGSGTNGVYAYSGATTFPSNAYQAANYWVDVTFESIPAAGAVTGVSATAGKASATVSWSAPSSGGTPTAYVVTPYVGSTPQTSVTVAGTPPPTSTTVTGLTPGTSYTFKVQAVNPTGSGPQSSASNAVTVLAPTAPAAPQNVAVEPATGLVRVSWTAPSDDGGSPLTGYVVTPYVGGVAQTPVPLGSGTTSTTVTGLTNGTAYTFAVTATNAVGGTSAPMSAAVTPQATIFDLATPATVDGGDGSPVDLGVKFHADQYGTVTGLRFYKAAANTGTHVGSLWTAGGALLAQATFANESASGWQTVTFSQPVDITPGTTYVASYHAPNGHYSVTPGGFTTAVDNGLLHAAANGTTPNGLYAYGGSPTFPRDSYNASNYWVDVLFTPMAAPGQVTGVSATAGRRSATVSWSAPSTGGRVTTYDVVPYVGSTAQPATTVAAPATSTTIGGLDPSTSYTFMVRASNPNGNGPLSAPSNAITPLPPIAPDAPTTVAAAAGAASARVTWTAPASDGGTPITGYTVTPYLGATALPPTTVAGSATSATVTGLSNGSSYAFDVTATNAAGSATSARSPAVTPGDTVLDFTSPATADANDRDAVELGVKFKSDQDGVVTGVRFYKSTANTGTHVGSLWTAGGTLLARATFSGESASGWETADFDQPVAVTAGTTYIASYHAPNGHYAATGSVFSSPVDNPPLHTIANAVSANGVYAYASTPTYPNNDFNATNYWVDVLFTPTAVPGQVTGVTATAGHAAATVSWTPPSSGGTPTSYDVIPYIGTTAQTAKTVSGSPLATSTTVSGLTPGTAYTFKVRASNTNGPGPLSAASNAVTPQSAVAPGAPTGVVAAAGESSAHVSWTAPASDGGTAITGYTVTPYAGATALPATTAGASATSASVTGLADGTAYTFKVTATNAVGSTDSAASASATPGHTLLDFGTPDRIDSGDPDAIEVGVKFTADQAGVVTGVRFYKSAANTGTHVATLWTAGGTQLARATVSGESDSGWQTVDFAQPVTLTAGTTYIASYHAPNGHYSATGSMFATAIDAPPLHTIANSVSGNGVYGTSSTPTFPNNSFNATNYWVDVLFTPAGT